MGEVKMDFEEVFKNLAPSIRQIARGFGNLPPHLDADDLAMEMFYHLWGMWKRGEVEGNTKSFLLQGCKFHALNYLRKEWENKELISLKESLNGESLFLEEIIPDNAPLFVESVEVETAIEKVKNDGLTARERQVFELCLKEYTTREIGQKLGISHVRVVKIMQQVREKVVTKNRV